MRLVRARTPRLSRLGLAGLSWVAGVGDDLPGRSRSGRSPPRAPEPATRPTALGDPNGAYGTDNQTGAKKPVRDIFGNREEDNTRRTKEGTR